MRAIVLTTMLAACGGSGNSVDLTDLGGQVGHAACEKIFACCTQAEITAQFQGASITTEASCELLIAGLYTQYTLPEYRASIADGRVIYNDDAVAPCVAQIDGLTCTAYSMDMNIDDFTSVSGCQPFFTAQVADNGACAQDYECTSNNCIGATTSPSTTDGTCMPLPLVNQPCVVNCAAGLYCGISGSTAVCLATKADGAACTGNDECTSGTCTASSTCATTGSVCNGT